MHRFFAFCSGFALFLIALQTSPTSGQAGKAAPKSKAKAVTKSFEPTAEQMTQFAAKTKKLEALTEKLRPQFAGHYAWNDAEIYLRAAKYLQELREYNTKEIAAQLEYTLEEGERRLQALAAGKPDWRTTPGTTSRAYRSKIDGTVQAYSVNLPPNYFTEPGPFRLDCFLHGRDGTLTEVKFLNTHRPKKDAPKAGDTITIDLYGRGNLAFRWAGETDLFEAYADFIATEKARGFANKIDPARRVIRGFSMGGAGAWHFGLHHPAFFTAMQPGAGFSITHGYVGKFEDKFDEPVESLLTIYDAVDYAANAAMIPVVAYSGSIDKQKLAADLVEKRLAALKLAPRMTHVIGEGLAHKLTPEYLVQVNRELDKRIAARLKLGKTPPIDFTTYTLKYAHAGWINLTRLTQHYRESNLKARLADGTIYVDTKGVQGFAILRAVPELQRAKNVVVNGGSPLALPPGEQPVYAEAGGTDDWKLANGVSRQTMKVPGLTGPIDDAFTERFVCVEGTGEPMQKVLQTAITKDLDTFEKNWKRYVRGDLPRVKDRDVDIENLSDANLILFGDPQSNRVIRALLQELPLKWDADRITLAGKSYPSKNHVPVLVFPNPRKPGRYVVINSTHTFKSDAFTGTNALLYPRVGDYGIYEVKDGQMNLVGSGLFDEFWR